MTTTQNPCTICGEPGIPGLLRGQGKCQYHWNAGAFGKVWADKVSAVPEQIEIVEHVEIVSSSGEKTTFYTWKNSVGNACGGFETYEAAVEDAMCFHIGAIEIVQ